MLKTNDLCVALRRLSLRRTSMYASFGLLARLDLVRLEHPFVFLNLSEGE